MPSSNLHTQFLHPKKLPDAISKKQLYCSEFLSVDVLSTDVIRYCTFIRLGPVNHHWTFNNLFFIKTRPQYYTCVVKILCDKTCVIKIRGTEITLQQTHFWASWSSKSPRWPSFPYLSRDLLPLSDLSTVEIPWILASRKAYKIVSIQTDFNPSNTCSKLIYQKPVPILKGRVSKNTAHRLITHSCE